MYSQIMIYISHLSAGGVKGSLEFWRLETRLCTVDHDLSIYLIFSVHGVKGFEGVFSRGYSMDLPGYLPTGWVSIRVYDYVRLDIPEYVPLPNTTLICFLGKGEEKNVGTRQLSLAPATCTLILFCFFPFCCNNGGRQTPSSSSSSSSRRTDRQTILSCTTGCGCKGPRCA